MNRDCNNKSTESCYDKKHSSKADLNAIPTLLAILWFLHTMYHYKKVQIKTCIHSSSLIND